MAQPSSEWERKHKTGFVDKSDKAYLAMRGALWIYSYLAVHADRGTGMLRRKLRTIATDMGLPLHTVQYSISKLRQNKYLTTHNSGRYLEIEIAKWKPLRSKKITFGAETSFPSGSPQVYTFHGTVTRSVLTMRRSLNFMESVN